MIEDTEIFLVVGAGFEFDVEVGSGFGEGVDVALVHGESEDVGFEGKDEGGAVALVDVEVDDHGIVDGFFGEEGADGDGDVVVDAESFADVGEGVVVSAAEVDREAGIEGAAGGEQGAARDDAQWVEEAFFDEIDVEVGDKWRLEAGGDGGGFFQALGEDGGVNQGDLGVGDGFGSINIFWAYQIVFNELLVDFGVLIEVKGVEIFETAEVNSIFVRVDDVEFHVGLYSKRTLLENIFHKLKLTNDQLENAKLWISPSAKAKYS